MKVLLALLLIANIGLGLLIFTAEEVGPPAVKPLLKSDKPLVLLAERDVTTAKIELNSPADVALNTEPKLSFVNRTCYSLGPFTEVSGVREVALILQRLGLTTIQRYTTQRELTGYWVYLPPFPSRSKAQQVVKVLKRKGVTDYLIVPTGKNENAISLGFFSTETAAQQRLKNMQNIDLLPILEKNYTDSSGFWLDFSTQDTLPIADDVITTLKEQYDGIEIEDKQCGG